MRIMEEPKEHVAAKTRLPRSRKEYFSAEDNGGIERTNLQPKTEPEFKLKARLKTLAKR